MFRAREWGREGRGETLVERLLGSDDEGSTHAPTLDPAERARSPDAISFSSLPSVDSAAGAGTIRPDELSDLTRNRDLTMLRAMGGVGGVADIISATVVSERGELLRKISDSAGSRVLGRGAMSDLNGMPASTEETRKRLYGRNDMTQLTPISCGFGRLLLGCLSDDPMVVLLAAASVALALGLIQCVPIVVAVPQGEERLRRCPSKPIWADRAPIQLPPPAHIAGGSACEAWTEGMFLLLMGVGLAAVKAWSEWWREKRLFEMLDWCRSNSQATVIRKRVSTRVRFPDVLVGDVVAVAKGDIVPADGILIEARGLRVDESAWPAESSLDPDDQDDRVRMKNVLDCPFLAAGSLVVEGEAVFLVTAVGIYSNWEAVSAAGLGSKLVAKLIRDPVPLRRPLERLARRITLFGHAAVAVCMVLRLIVFALHMLTSSCFDVVVEKCVYGAAGLNNRTLCVDEGYTWAPHLARSSAADLWLLVEAVLNVTTLFMLLVPHGLTAVVSGDRYRPLGIVTDGH